MVPRSSSSSLDVHLVPATVLDPKMLLATGRAGSDQDARGPEAAAVGRTAAVGRGRTVP